MYFAFTLKSIHIICGHDSYKKNIFLRKLDWTCKFFIAICVLTHLIMQWSTTPVQIEKSENFTGEIYPIQLQFHSLDLISIIQLPHPPCSCVGHFVQSPSPFLAEVDGRSRKACDLDDHINSYVVIAIFWQNQDLSEFVLSFRCFHCV